MKKMKSVLALVAMCFMVAMPLTAVMVHDGGDSAVVLQVNEAQAQSEAPAAPAPAEEVKKDTFLDSILSAIGSSTGIVAGLLMALEFIFRLVPTKVPWSLFMTLQYGFSGLGVICTFIGDLFKKIVEAGNRTK